MDAFYKEDNGIDEKGDIKPDLKTEFQAFINAEWLKIAVLN